MNLFNLMAKISIDDKEFERGVASATEASERMQDQITALAKQYQREAETMSEAMEEAHRNISEDAKKAFEEASKKLKEYNDKMDNAIAGYNSLATKSSNALAKIGKGFVGLGAAVTAGAGVIAKFGTDYNSQIEQYTSSFSTMLGSAEEGVKHLSQLKEFAAKTPFELQDLAQASQTLLAFGADVKEVEPSLKMLGDISLGNAEKFKSLALVFGQVSSQGKLMGGDLLQMEGRKFYRRVA